jgi:intein-encoded DNA endonuclease-like protein
LVIWGVRPKRLRKTKILPEEAKKLSPELAYILGVTEGDGCLCRAKRKSLPGENYDYILTLGVTDSDFADHFSENIEKWLSFKPYRNKRPQRGMRTKDVHIMRLRSKDAYEFLSDFDLDNLLESDDKIKSRFLKVFYDSEGSVPKNKKARSIFVDVINLRITTLVRKLLKSMKINLSNLQEANATHNQKYYYFHICSTKSLELFRDKIGFSIQRKQDRLINLLNQLPSSEEIIKKKKGYLNNRKTLYCYISENPGLCQYDISKKIEWNRHKVDVTLNFY